jgi:two-component system, cell cycle sensor histidine kinase and response regulator CckA
MEAKLRLSVDHLLEGVQIIDREWRYVYLNATAATQGRRPAEELLGRTMMECYPGIETTDLFRALERVMETRRAEMLRNEFSYPSGDRRWFELLIDPVPDGVCVLSLDITERRKAELELHHAQRMDAIGKLAGGIAHDFNNQLTAIHGFTQLLLENTRDENIRRDLQAINDAAERSAALTRQLLAFSRRQMLQIEPMDVNVVVTNVDRLLQRLLGADVACEVRLHPRAAMILGDAQQLENVLTNLAVNARDAMPNRGRLTISTDVVELTEDDADQHASMASGSYAVLTVADTGRGMDEATKARIFEPFFTTKSAGKGTGLGLSTAYGVVKQMGGFIWVYSEVGHGTIFRLYFPTSSEPVRPQAGDALSPTHRGATILVVEDDRGVRDLVSRALNQNGYTVVTAATGDDARRIVREMPTPPDLVFVDVVLPGESGPELIPTLAAGNARVLFMSGYSEEHIHERGLNGTVLEKPFTIPDLLRAIDHALVG